MPKPADYVLTGKKATAPAAESEAATDDGLTLTGVGQTYETTIRADGVPSMRFLSIPLRVLGLDTTDTRPDSWYTDECLRILGLDEFDKEEFFPAQLPGKLWQCLTEGRPMPHGNLKSWSVEDQRLFTFAQYLAFEDLIPFELSEQRSRSLGKLMSVGGIMGATLAGTATGAKVGVAGGLFIGAPTGPLIFVAAGAGLVVGGLVGAVTGAVGYKVADYISGSPKPS